MTVNKFFALTMIALAFGAFTRLVADEGCDHKGTSVGTVPCVVKSVCIDPARNSRSKCDGVNAHEVMNFKERVDKQNFNAFGYNTACWRSVECVWEGDACTFVENYQEYEPGVNYQQQSCATPGEDPHG
jgi:hypothetical protein